MSAIENIGQVEARYLTQEAICLYCLWMGIEKSSEGLAIVAANNHIPLACIVEQIRETQ